MGAFANGPFGFDFGKLEKPNPDADRMKKFIAENSERLADFSAWVRQLAKDDLDQFNAALHFFTETFTACYALAKKIHGGDDDG